MCKQHGNFPQHCCLHLKYHTVQLTTLCTAIDVSNTGQTNNRADVTVKAKISVLGNISKISPKIQYLISVLYTVIIPVHSSRNMAKSFNTLKTKSKQIHFQQACSGQTQGESAGYMQYNHPQLAQAVQ